MTIYITYYKTLYKQYRTYNSETKEFITMNFLPTKTVSSFYMFGKYEANDEDLVRYSEDLYKSTEQLKTYHKFKGYKQRFDYIEPFKMRDGKYMYKNHDSNIIKFFKLLASETLLNTLEPITKIEAKWMKKTYNAGLQYLFKKGQFQSYGYDFSNQ